MLFYTTDDSHAYANWNNAMPFDPSAWGVTLFPGPDFSPRSFALLDASIREGLQRKSRIVIASTLAPATTPLCAIGVAIATALLQW